MTGFRILLGTNIVVLGIYTAAVVADHGINFYPFYLRDVAAVGWPGQFDLDFTAMLILAGLWMAWRNHFSVGGIMLGLLVTIVGAPLLCTYLLVLLARHKGDMGMVLLGETRAASLV